MSARGRIARRLAAAAASVACLIALAALWQLRPPLAPALALDAVMVGGLLRWLLWLTLVLLVLVLLARAMRGRRDASASWSDVRSGRKQAAPRLALLDVGRDDRRVSAREREPARYVPGWARPRVALVGREDGSAALAAPSPAEFDARSAQVSVLEAEAEAHPSLLLLGPLEIPSETRRRRRAPGPAHELVAYLALHPEGASRDELLEALWPNDDPRRSEQRLWQASKEARRLLAGGVVRESGRYRLDRARVEVDVDRLERLLARVGAVGEELGEQELVEQALALFRGEPLEGCDFRWAGGDVRRLAARRLELLERAGRARLAHGDAGGALDAAEQGIRADELNETFWRLALEVEAASGAREAMTRRYDDLSGRLDTRLGLKPSAETRTLYLRLLGDD